VYVLVLAVSGYRPTNSVDGLMACIAHRCGLSLQLSHVAWPVSLCVTIQYNTKFGKRHIAALANRTGKKHRRRRTNVL